MIWYGIVEFETRSANESNSNIQWYNWSHCINMQVSLIQNIQIIATFDDITN